MGAFFLEQPVGRLFKLGQAGGLQALHFGTLLVQFFVGGFQSDAGGGQLGGQSLLSGRFFLQVLVVEIGVLPQLLVNLAADVLFGQRLQRQKILAQPQLQNQPADETTHQGREQ